MVLIVRTRPESITQTLKDVSVVCDGMCGCSEFMSFLTSYELLVLNNNRVEDIQGLGQKHLTKCRENVGQKVIISSIVTLIT